MADKLIQITERTVNGYMPYNTVNDTKNIIGYESLGYDNVLERIQDIANKYIAPDAAYWQDITDHLYNALSDPMETKSFSNFKMANYGNFIVFIGSYKIQNDDYYNWCCLYSYDGGLNWNYQLIMKMSSRQSVNKIVCKPIYLGYRVEAIINNSLILSLLCNYDNISQSPVWELVPLRRTAENVISNTPYGFLASVENSSNYEECLYYISNYLSTRNKILANSYDTTYTTFGTISKTSNSSYLDIYDEMLAKFIFYSSWTENSTTKKGFRLFDFKNFSNNTPTNIESINNYSKCANALNRAFFLSDDGVYYINNNFIETKIDFPIDDPDIIWNYIFGNTYRLYLISEDGDIAYLNNVDEEWHVANQTINMSSNTGYSVLNVNAPFNNFEVITDEENTYIMAIINNSVFYTPVNNLL